MSGRSKTASAPFVAALLRAGIVVVEWRLRRTRRKRAVAAADASLSVLEGVWNRLAVPSGGERSAILALLDETGAEFPGLDTAPGGTLSPGSILRAACECAEAASRSKSIQRVRNDLADGNVL